MPRVAPRAGLRRRSHLERGPPSRALASASSCLAAGARPAAPSEEACDDAEERRPRCPGLPLPAGTRPTWAEEASEAPEGSGDTSLESAT
eukprot:5220717-Lingulodinium_polyedra.AAC.1